MPICVPPELMTKKYTFVARDVTPWASTYVTTQSHPDLYLSHPEWVTNVPTMIRNSRSMFECGAGTMDVRFPHELDIFAQPNGNIAAQVWSMFMPSVNPADATTPSRDLKLNARTKARIFRELLAAKLISYHEYVGMLEFNGCLTQENLHPELIV